MADNNANGLFNEDVEEATVTLELDDGKELECDVICIYTAGEHDYIALLPQEAYESEEGEVFLYRYSEENGEPVLENILDDEEFEIASEAFDEFLDSSEYDEIVSEDDIDKILDDIDSEK